MFYYLLFDSCCSHHLFVVADAAFANLAAAKIHLKITEHPKEAGSHRGRSDRWVRKYDQTLGSDFHLSTLNSGFRVTMVLVELLLSFLNGDATAHGCVPLYTTAPL